MMLPSADPPCSDMKSSKGGPLGEFRAAIKSLNSLADDLVEADSSEQPTLQELATLLSAEQVAA
jgi:hypothetical protein